MTTDLLLLPHPRQLTLTGGVHSLPETGLIALTGDAIQTQRFAAAMLQTALLERTGATWEIVAGSAAPADQIQALLAVTPGSNAHPQGYQLTVSDAGINIVAESPVGLFYGVLTLVQILGQTGAHPPNLRCSDRPDFPHRGVMLDVSRNRVPTMATLYDLVDLLASWKINQLQLYTEHTFAYRSHPQVWADASPFTGEEILALDAYCRERFIELVPNQNTFGHLHHWLKLPRYRHLAEAIDGADTPWGFFREGPFSISPAVPESMDLVRSMLDELLPHFSSNQVNIGGDETYDLGQGQSKALVEERGKSQVYLDFILKIYREVRARGKTMQLWGDIIMENPELASQLPRDVIALEWGYEADHPFDEHGAIFADSGVPFYVCCGTSSWNTIGGRTENAVGNLRNAAENGLKHGAIGYLITDWGDNGQLQPWPVSYLGLAYGAGLAWSQPANRDMDLPAILDHFVFRDRNGVMGRLAYDLGNVYLKGKARLHNSITLFWILQQDILKLLADGPLAVETAEIDADLTAMEAEIARVIAPLDSADMARPDAALIQAEFRWAAAMLSHACRRGRWIPDQNPAVAAELDTEAVALIDDFDAIWFARNRKGGYDDARRRLEALQHEYQQRLKR